MSFANHDAFDPADVRFRRPVKAYAERDAAEQRFERRRTRRLLTEYLLKPARYAFPQVPVVAGGRAVPRPVVDAAWAAAETQRRVRGYGPPFDPLVAFARAA